MRTDSVSCSGVAEAATAEKATRRGLAELPVLNIIPLSTRAMARGNSGLLNLVINVSLGMAVIRQLT